MHRLITLLFIIAFLPTLAQENPLIGTWVVTNVELDDYHIHDTITFKPDGKFLTTTIKQTMNDGKWSKRLFKSRELKLKACLHSADNPYKCRKFHWTWEIEKMNQDELIVIQHSGWGKKKLNYKKIKTTPQHST